MLGESDSRAVEIGNRIDLRFKLFDPVGVREAVYLGAALSVVLLCFAVLRGMSVTERLFTGMFMSAPLCFLAFVRFQDLAFEHWLVKKWRFWVTRKRYVYASVFQPATPPPASSSTPTRPAAQNLAPAPAQPVTRTTAQAAASPSERGADWSDERPARRAPAYISVRGNAGPALRVFSHQRPRAVKGTRRWAGVSVGAGLLLMTIAALAYLFSLNWLWR